MSLCLHESADHSQAAPRLSIAHDHRGKNCVKRPLATFKPVGMSILQCESGSAILKNKSGSWHCYSRTKRFEDAADHRNDISLLVYHCNVDCVSAWWTCDRRSVSFGSGINSSLFGVFFRKQTRQIDWNIGIRNALL